VIGARDFPEHHPGIREFYSAGVAHWNVAVNLAVDEEHGNLRVCDRALGRYAGEVEMISPARVDESYFDDRT
jgi:hypothetical protein